MTPFTALKNFSPFHFISLYIYLFIIIIIIIIILTIIICFATFGLFALKSGKRTKTLVNLKRLIICILDTSTMTMIKIMILIFAVQLALWIVRTGIMHDTMTVALSTV